ncbi:MAG: flavin reductase family protein [Chloroflexi bacterium]|nr:flavin reductase family protein [Chloroflexota bacterium]
MKRISVPFDHRLTKTLALLQDPGLLLAAAKRSGEANAMAIGWATVGIIWGKPIFVAMVRPSRYTYEFIEDSKAFTVNVPSSDQRKWVEVCGTNSGRDMDKFGELHIAVSPALTVNSITLDACPMVYECRVLHYNDIVPTQLDAETDSSAYQGSNYHRLYYGEILGAFASEDY